MKRSAEILKKALEYYCNRDKYCYFYGAKGETMTDKRMNDLISAYPRFYQNYSKQQLEDIKNFSRGKRGLDCSGFISKISGVPGYSASLIDKCVVKTTPRNGKAGYLLYKPGHVGIDLGYGFQIDMSAPGHTLEIHRISEKNYTESGALPGYDYSEAVNY